jgi:dihydroorotase
LYSLLIKNGEVVAPADGLRGRLDVAVSGGKIAAIAPSITDVAQRILDVRGAVIAPGLIDLHTHVDFGMRTRSVNARGVHPDLVGVRAGVPTIVDAGTTGPLNFGGFRHYVIDPARTRVLSFLHVARGGISMEPDIRFEEDVDFDAFFKAAEEHRDIIVGVKTRLFGPGLQTLGVRIAELAMEAARTLGLPVMMHTGDHFNRWDGAPDVTRKALVLMQPGDIIEHIYTDLPGGVVDDKGRVMPEFKEAVERGIIAGSSSGAVMSLIRPMRVLYDAGLLPGFIGTDLNSVNRTAGCYSLTESMSRHMAFGLTLDEVVALTTSAPAKIIGRQDTLGHLAVGRDADISILRVLDGKWRFADRDGDSIYGTKAVVPALTIRSGELIDLDWGPHPWGWEPEYCEAPAVAN